MSIFIGRTRGRLKLSRVNLRHEVLDHLGLPHNTAPKLIAQSLRAKGIPSGDTLRKWRRLAQELGLHSQQELRGRKTGKAILVLTDVN